MVRTLKNVNIHNYFSNFSLFLLNSNFMGFYVDLFSPLIEVVNQARECIYPRGASMSIKYHELKLTVSHKFQSLSKSHFQSVSLCSLPG